MALRLITACAAIGVILLCPSQLMALAAAGTVAIVYLLTIGV